MWTDHLRRGDPEHGPAVEELGEVGSGSSNRRRVQKGLWGFDREAPAGGGGDDGGDEQGTGVGRREKAQDDHQPRRHPPYRVNIQTSHA